MRILIAGLGAIGQRHARNLRTICGDGLELLAYRRRRLPYVITESLQRDDSRDVETALGIRAFDDLDAALDARPDAVFVCTPTSQHLEIALRAAAAGCHLFIEKPVSHTWDSVEDLCRAVAAGRLVAMVGCQWRFHPRVRSLRDDIQSERLGVLREAGIDYAEYLPDWHPYEDYRASYAARADLGGGVVLTQIHDYDLAYWLFGRPTHVRASGGRVSDLEIDVEDSVDAVLDGGLCHVRISQTFASTEKHRIVWAAGERGTAEVDLLGVPGYERNQMFLDEVRHFLACVRGAEPPLVPLEDGVEVLRVALAVKESMQQRRTVRLS